MNLPTEDELSKSIAVILEREENRECGLVGLKISEALSCGREIWSHRLLFVDLAGLRSGRIHALQFNKCGASVFLATSRDFALLSGLNMGRPRGAEFSGSFFLLFPKFELACVIFCLPCLSTQ